RPFVSVNCAALSSSLLESELFGHEKGAFTHATHLRKGRFEIADGGVLLLDEIGELPQPLQPKLLRVLQEHAFERVGSSRTFQVDVCVIATTNRDLAGEVDAGRFREDLYHRLNVIHVELPPLRARRSEIPLLVAHILQRRKHPEPVPSEIMDELFSLPLPGNVRELENLIDRWITLGAIESVRMKAPASAGERKVSVITDFSLAKAVEDAERQHIEMVVKEAGGSRRRAAAMLGIDRGTLRAKLEKYGLAVLERLLLGAE
ncbi:MAG: sigma 54-interacting transcriptional regulator, partial [Acidobacteria bacterium]|nr:sigma 54-interacting transcriptional regulator [Acidobacteriota bacterium]